MKKLFIALSIITCLYVEKTIAQTVQIPSIQWSKVYGGTESDGIYDIQYTTDGGYIVTGWSHSYSNAPYAAVASDCLVIKLDDSGNVQWQKVYGGNSSDGANAIRQTTDGGYIFAGYTASNDGDFFGNHGSEDAWVLKLDNSGNVQWQKFYGGTLDDAATCIQQTTDGGYIVSGYTASNNGNVSYNHGNRDAWVIKLDNSGNIQWQKSYGGTKGDEARTIQQTPDGGYIVAGYTGSNNGDVSGFHGGTQDIWVWKLTNSGTIQWQKAIGGSGEEVAQSIQLIKDGGYILVGNTNSGDGDAIGNPQYKKSAWVIKLIQEGPIQWQKTYGGSNQEYFFSVRETQDNGYIIGGEATSNDGDVSGNHGSYDAWIVKLDNMGALQWQKAIGGSGFDFAHAYSILQTSDGGYVFAGSSSSNDGDVSGNIGLLDFWIVKLGTENNMGTENILVKNNISIYPNPAKDFIYINLPETEKIKSISITDISGKLIKIANSKENKVDVSFLPNGVYFLKIETNHTTYNRKISKK